MATVLKKNNKISNREYLVNIKKFMKIKKFNILKKNSQWLEPILILIRWIKRYIKIIQIKRR